MFSVRRGSDGGQMEQGSALHRDPSSSASLAQRSLQPGAAERGRCQRDGGCVIYDRGEGECRHALVTHLSMLFWESRVLS